MAKAAADAVEPWQANLLALESEMQRRLNERGANNSATPSGTFFKKRLMIVKVVDRPAFLEYVYSSRDSACLTAAISKEGVKEYMDSHKVTVADPSGGPAIEVPVPPPGVAIDYLEQINVRKA